jgi:hypothetical protein
MSAAGGTHPGNWPQAQAAARFDLQDKVAIVTGGTGVLGGMMARGLAMSGARTGILGRRREKAERVASEIEEAGGRALALPANVLNKEQLEEARQAVVGRWGSVDILVNAAGGNVPEATLGESASIFDLPQEPIRQVFDLFPRYAAPLPGLWSRDGRAKRQRSGRKRVHREHIVSGRLTAPHQRSWLLRS